MMEYKTHKKSKISCFLFLLVFILASKGCAPRLQQQEFITIGALLPLTGESSDEGLRALNGLHLAKEEINASGGVLGKMLDIIVLNDRGDREYIIEQYNRLLEKGVSAIIGSSYSGPTLALAMTSVKDGMPIITPTASNPIITEGRPNVFRTIFIDDYQAEAMANFAYNYLGARRAVVLANQNFASYIRTARVFAQTFTALGGYIMAYEYFSSEDDFPYLLAKHAHDPPDVIFCPEDFIPAARLINTAHELGLRYTRLLGSDAWDGVLAYVFESEAMERAYYSAPFMFDDQSEEVARFVRNYFDRFAQMPLTGSATAYICVYIIADAIERAGNTNREDIVSAMKSTNLDTIIGRMYFDHNNNPRTNVYVIQIKGGEYSTYAKLSL